MSFKSLTLFTLLLSAQFCSHASTYSWQRNSEPLGATASKILPHPESENIVYIATGIPGRALQDELYDGAIKPGGGVFKSFDGGATWQTANQGLTDRNVTDLTFHPHDPDILYAATFDGVFRSDDAGNKWIALPGIGLREDRRVNKILVDSDNPSVLYAISPYPIPLNISPVPPFNQLFYRSDDGGVHWHQFSPQLDGVITNLGFLADIFLHPESPGTFFISQGYKLLKSTDNGMMLQEISFPTQIASFFRDLTRFDPHQADGLYSPLTPEGTIARSSDGGETWMLIESGQSFPDLIVRDVLVHPQIPELLYTAGVRTGLLRSFDAGESWQLLNPGEGRLRPLGEDIYLLAASANGRYLYAMTSQDGLLRSLDNGDSWEPANTGLNAAMITDIAIDAGTADTVYAVVAGELYKTTDRGLHWELLNTHETVGVISRMASDPQIPNTLYAFTPKDNSAINATTSMLVKSVDGGKSWAAVSSNPPIQGHLSVSPHDSNVLFTGGISNSLNGGKSWERLHERFNQSSAEQRLPPSVVSFAFEPQNSAVLYVGTTTYGIFKTTDGGRQWRQLPNGLESAVLKHAPPVADSGGLNMGFAPVYGLVIDPDNPQVIYASFTDNGLYKSINGGESWFPVSTAEEMASISALAMSDGTLYAGTSGAGVFRLDDAGAADNTAFLYTQSNKLALPLIDIGLPGEGLSLTMKLVDASNLVFEVESFAPANLETGAIGQFSAVDGKLHIPRLAIDDDLYSVDLLFRNTTTGMPQFVVSSIEILIE